MTNLTIEQKGTTHTCFYDHNGYNCRIDIPLHMLTKFANGREVTDEVVEEYIEKELKNI